MSFDASFVVVPSDSQEARAELFSVLEYINSYLLIDRLRVAIAISFCGLSFPGPLFVYSG